MVVMERQMSTSTNLERTSFKGLVRGPVAFVRGLDGAGYLPKLQFQVLERQDSRTE